MPVRRGESWGGPGRLPEGAVVVRSDAEARSVVEAHRRENRSLPVLGLLGGDLCRTLGGRGTRTVCATVRRPVATVDVGSALLDGRQHWFVAHLVARRSWLRGRVFVAMNAEWFGSWSLGPRAHPNDGLVDISDGSPSLGDRLRARRRLPTGTHLPHPEIRTERTGALQRTFDPPLPVWLDAHAGRAGATSVPPRRARRPHGRGLRRDRARRVGTGYRELVDPETAKRRVIEEIDRRAEVLVDLAHDIHAHPELCYEESYAHGRLCDLLVDEGFAVDRAPGGLDTAFRTEVGRGGHGSRSCASTTAAPDIGHTCRPQHASVPPGSAPAWRPRPWCTSWVGGSWCSGPPRRRGAAGRSDSSTAAPSTGSTPP
ncbi:MAG: hypothetical protein U5R31_04490 [Acidimicrobiia bacterium]|nr:hypothetical protein [Acidimicrobiia bacterium]